MKLKLYLTTLLLFFFACFFSSKINAQVCSIGINYTTTESRCVATGSITVNVTGGSGSYNYKAVGTISTAYTSSNVITGLPQGYYTLIVKDLDSNCTQSVDSVLIGGSYADPRFQLSKTDVTCIGNDGSVSVINQEFGRGPFLYTLIAPSPTGVGDTSYSGNFNNLSAGEYFVQLKDSCGGIQVRSISIQDYTWWFDSYSVTRIGCDSASVFMRLKDSKGNINITDSVFDGFNYGYIDSAGDTLWYSTENFTIFIGTERTVVLVAKDLCGNIHSVTWNLPESEKPAIGNITASNFTCNTFTATTNGQINLTSPEYCLIKDDSTTVISCNTTGIFDDLDYGTYCLKVTDNCYDTTIIKCFTVYKPVPTVDEQINISDRTCERFTARVTGQQNLIDPVYCLYDSTGTELACNDTGVFEELLYGAYCIFIKDGCVDTIIKRCFEVERLMPTLNGPGFSNITCNSFVVNVNGNNLLNPWFCLYDANGNVIECNSTGIFDSLPHGNYCIQAKTECGDTTNMVCFTSMPPQPTVNATVATYNLACSTFAANVSGQNLTNPQYCLFNSSNVLVACNTTGVFNGLLYGNYEVHVTDGCIDTTIIRSFAGVKPTPTVNANVNQSNSTCSTFTATVTGSNLFNAQYCVYDNNNFLISCNTTGVFTNLAYGSYCFVVTDGCTDTTISVCQTFAPSKNLTVSAGKSCTIGYTSIEVNIQSPGTPYTINIFHPNGMQVYSGSTSSNQSFIPLPALPLSFQYRVVAMDNCGWKDTLYIAPDATKVTKSVLSNSKCPSASWANGSGDIVVNTTSNYYPVYPRIIKKNGASINLNYTNQSGSNFTFADLEPATYIIEYNMQTCNTKLYDTFLLAPYTYPNQQKSAIYQCDDNSFSLGAVVNGGVGPFSYEIIGSQPETPSIITAPQTSPIFNISNGTTYSLIRLRTIDACGNATLSDVSVLPLQNVIIKANSTCLYNYVVLSVDTIPNATYKWYKKLNDTDSIQVGDSINYTIPFFVPEDIGLYVCKVSVNDGCLIRISYFNLSGDCGYIHLPIAIKLQGRKLPAANELIWNTEKEKDVIEYIVERKAAEENGFVSIGKIKSITTTTSNSYKFVDNNPKAGVNHYRIKIIYSNGTVEYSNTISLRSESFITTVYPNPVKNILNVSIDGKAPANYAIEIMNIAGQTIYQQKLENVTRTTFSYNRSKAIKPGIYLLKILNMNTATVETFKVMFE